MNVTQLCFLSTFTLFCMLAAAQQSASDKSSDAPNQGQTTAPVPAQITNARKVFITNGGGENVFKGGPDRAYNQFYAGLKESGQYELMAAPADADLVLEIAQRVLRDGDGRVLHSEFKLNIVDPKTHVSLWSMTEKIRHEMDAKSRVKAYGLGANPITDKDFDKTMSRLIEDLRKLAGTPPQAAAS
jgi:hypothetical protein